MDLPWQTVSMLRMAMIAVYAGGAGCGYHIAKGFFDTVSISLDEAAMLDGAVIISIPVAALFLATQKYYVEGVSGAVKD